MDINEFEFPTTRFSGSKRRFRDWIWYNVKDLEFDSVLDPFGGTASISLLFKLHGKQVFFNDLLRSSQIIGASIIQNDYTKVTREEAQQVIEIYNGDYDDLIERKFSGLYFTNEENQWLDRVTQNIFKVENQFKKFIMLAALAQSCLIKRPFGKFHRANLNFWIEGRLRRTSFGNQRTWDAPFEKYFGRFIEEFSNAIFSNGKKNIVIGGYDALEIPDNDADLIYLDPPYLPVGCNTDESYFYFYHFIDGLCNYENWEDGIIDDNRLKIGHEHEGFSRFICGTKLRKNFEKLFDKFRNSIIVVSYRSDGYISIDEIIDILRHVGKCNISVKTTSARYAFNRQECFEVLVIAK